MDTKVCVKCGENKPLTEYWNHPTGRFKKRPRCKLCVSRENNDHLRRREEKEPGYNRHRVQKWNCIDDNKRRRNLRTLYGMTIEEYDRMLAAQNNVCAICGLPSDEGRRLAVDHDHATGKIRGIVHVRCNTAIALFRDSPEICRAAAEYLEQQGQCLLF